MREYGQIQTCFWTDPDIQSLTDQGKLLATYLLTGPHSNGIGCYRLPNGYVQADLGWKNETISKGFTELFRIGFIERCETTFFVVIPKYLKWNKIANPNVAKAREEEFRAIPSKSLIYKTLCESMLSFGSHWTEPFRKGLETVCRTYSKQNPTLPNPIPNPITPPTPPSGGNGKKDNRHRGNRLPDDWCITGELLGWMMANTPDLNVNHTIDTFKDYWKAQPGQKGVKTDWPATFRNWCRRANENHKGNGRPQSAATRFKENLQNALGK